jgi:hypothetical protein
VRSLDVVRVVLISVLALTLGTREADACLCPRPEPRTLPASNAEGVPTNLRSIYAFEALSGDGRLVGDDGHEVPLELVDLPGSRRRLYRVTAELRPNLLYRVAGSSGVIAFTTGDGPDLEPPPSPRFEDFAVVWDPGEHNTCGPRTIVVSGLIAAPIGTDIATMGLRFTNATGEVNEAVLSPRSGVRERTGEQVWFPSELGTSSCGNYLALDAAETYAVEAWSIDRAGNLSETTVQSVYVSGDGCSAGAGQAFGCLLVLLPVLVTRRRRLART